MQTKVSFVFFYVYVVFTVILGDIKVLQSISNEMHYPGVTKPLSQVLATYICM